MTPTTGNVPFGFYFTWSGTSALDTGTYEVYLNGTKLELKDTPAHSDKNLASSGAEGTNLYVLEFVDTTSNKPVYMAVAELELSDVTPTDKPTSFKISGTPTVWGSNSIPAPIGVAPKLDPKTNTSYTITYPASPAVPNSPVVLSINFNPLERKEFAEVKPVNTK